MTKEIVMINGDDAAKPHTMSGWISRNKRFYDNEELARYDGCTHRPCQTCGEPTEKHWTVCKVCRAKKDNETWSVMPYKEWGDEPVVIHMTDTYFF